MNTYQKNDIKSKPGLKGYFYVKILTCALPSTHSKLVVEITQLSLYLYMCPLALFRKDCGAKILLIYLDFAGVTKLRKSGRNMQLLETGILS
jgi:hypothetical protein